MERVPLDDSLHSFFINDFIVSKFYRNLSLDLLEQTFDIVHLFLFILVHTNARLLPDAEPVSQWYVFQLSYQLFSGSLALVFVCLRA